MPAGHSATQPFVDGRRATFHSVILSLQLAVLGWVSAFGAQWSSSIPRGHICVTRINSTEQIDGITNFPGVFRFSMCYFFIQCSNSPANVYNLKKTTLIWVSSDYLRDVMRLRRDHKPDKGMLTNHVIEVSRHRVTMKGCKTLLRGLNVLLLEKLESRPSQH